jgi:hypothetical protein
MYCGIRESGRFVATGNLGKLYWEIYDEGVFAEFNDCQFCGADITTEH